MSLIDLSVTTFTSPFHQSQRKYLTLSLGWIINQEKAKLKPFQVFPFVGYEYHLDSALREMAQSSGFDLTLKVKTCFDFKMFDVGNWVAHLNGEDSPGGTPSHETLSVSPQGALEFFFSHWTSYFLGQRPFQVTWSSGKVPQT